MNIELELDPAVVAEAQTNLEVGENVPAIIARMITLASEGEVNPKQLAKRVDTEMRIARAFRERVTE